MVFTNCGDLTWKYVNWNFKFQIRVNVIIIFQMVIALDRYQTSHGLRR